MSLFSRDDLRRTLGRIDGRGYKAYQDLRGTYELDGAHIEIAHVQGDPYAPPSRLHARIDLTAAGLLPLAEGPMSRRRALEDFLGRSLARAIRDAGCRDLAIDPHGQEMLLRSAVRVRGPQLEIRLALHLPAAGRRVRGPAAQRILLRDLPAILAQGATADALDLAQIARHQDVCEDHAALGVILRAEDWVAFVADGAILPRRAGHDDRPLEQGAVPFRAPASLAREITLPHAGCVRGMAIPYGVTLLVGGGFHGKSTLLDAVARGIYPHIPGDGRERIAADRATVKVRAEDGRAVTGTDISPFIGELPYGRSTHAFTTPNASGSTSQAANIIEAIEAGARVLLLDEDTSATNFMIRDEPMRRLLKPGQEPITPFLDRVRNLHSDRGISTVLVVGGSGEYFRVADRVIQMDRYIPADVTARAREIAPPGTAESASFHAPGAVRRLRFVRYQRRIGPRGPRVKAHGTARLIAEREEIDLGACEGLVASAQVCALAEILERLLAGQGRAPVWRDLSRGLTAPELTAALEGFGEELLEEIARHPRGDLAEVRAIEVIAMLNRLRELNVDLEGR